MKPVRALQQTSVCERVGALPSRPEPGSKLGIALSTIENLPIHGVRHLPTASTSGWYIWCGGEPSVSQDFFAPLHVEHLSEYLPSAVEYLDLPPGYRFLIDGSNHEDVWFDESLLMA